MKKKSLSAKKIIPKSLNFKKILADKKIFEIYQKFSKNFKKLDKSSKIAVSVSGGPDSMALSFFVNCYKYQNNNEIKPFFFLVDHGLRKDSAIEANLVKKQLRLKKINLKILKWKGKKPRSNLQSIARKRRYELLFNECKKLNIKTILTAHHQDDIYETFFSRLLRGSGIEGLTSFTETEKKFLFNGNTITVARPLLTLNKQNLIYVAQKAYQFYIEDPSNEMDKFQRVRLRKLISNFKNLGLDFNKLILTLNNLASSNKAINELTHFNISKNVVESKNKFLIKLKFFTFPDEVIFRSLSSLIKKISKKDYPPRGKKIMKLIKELKYKNQYKATLGGTIIEKIHNSVVVTKEKTKKR